MVSCWKEDLQAGAAMQSDADLADRRSLDASWRLRQAGTCVNVRSEDARAMSVGLPGSVLIEELRVSKNPQLTADNRHAAQSPAKLEFTIGTRALRVSAVRFGASFCA